MKVTGKLNINVIVILLVLFANYFQTDTILHHTSRNVVMWNLRESQHKLLDRLVLLTDKTRTRETYGIKSVSVYNLVIGNAPSQYQFYYLVLVASSLSVEPLWRV